MVVKAPHPEVIEAANYGGRQDKIKWVVLHSAVAPCKSGEARNIANMFHNTKEDKSAHYVVDPTQRFQCVPDHNIAYHCGYNIGSLAIEMCEYPSHTNKKRWDGKNHRLMETNAAHLTARLCFVYGVPPWYRSALSLKLGLRGVTTHAQMTKAFKQSTHWDPGAWRRSRSD